VLVILTASADLSEARASLSELGLWTTPLVSPGDTKAVWIQAHSAQVPAAELRALPFVAEVMTPGEGRPLVSRWRGLAVDVGGLQIGVGQTRILAAGPCSAESREQVEACGAAVAEAGGQLLRGGAYKPRTSPYAFAGHGPDALGWLRDAADRHDLRVVTEVLSEADVAPVAEVADLIQIGTRNMQSFGLLRAVGTTGKPVLLKRGRAATVDEWLDAAEHLLAAGAGGVIYCERGVRGFDPRTRNLFDLGAVALMAHVERLPVLADPSHAAGRRDLLEPLSAAALAAGAHGLLLETHPDPSSALSDGPQALPLAELVPLAGRLGLPSAALA
jgi:3-deoxy-7-phosphoheptulonate synthase